jgi:predicted PurR-regulated permease PerM
MRQSGATQPAAQGANLDRYTKDFVIAVTALLALALYWMLAPLWGALAWGVCLAFLLAPVHRWLTRKLQGRASVSAGAITALVPLLLAAPLVSLGVAFVRQVTELATHLQQRQPLRFDASLLAQLERYPLIGSVADWLRQHLTATTEQLDGWLADGAKALLQSLAAKGGTFVLSALGTAVEFFVMLFLLFFLLRDGGQLIGRVVRLVPMEPRRRGELLKLVGDTTRAVVYGEVLTALAQGALVGVGFAIAGLPSSVVFGVLAAVMALLPVGGAALVWAPAVIFLAAASQWGWAIFMLIWGTGVSVSDNLMRPLLIARRAPVSMPAVFVGVIGGVSAFGMIGVIIGPVLLTVVAALLRFLDETLARQPGNG